MEGKAGYEVKGSLVRGYVQQIDKLGLTAEVMAAVSAETRAQMKDLPLTTSWVDAMVIEEMIAAVDTLRGTAAVRTIIHDGQLGTVLPLLRPFISGVLRLFGGSPLTLLQRFEQMSRLNVRGLELEWTTQSERSGRLRVKFPRKNIPRSAFVGFETGIGNIFEVCSVAGKVEETQISADGSTGTIAVSW
jgi:hypothetical protein